MKFLFVIAMVVFSGFAYAVNVPEELLNAISTVESNNDDKAIGDSGKAVGHFQIWKTYVDEVNRISRLKKLPARFSYEDRKNPEKSRQMVIIYLEFWGKQYEKDTRRPATMEVLAKIHNGHAFWKRSPKNKQYFSNIERYWEKVKNELENWLR